MMFTHHLYLRGQKMYSIFDISHLQAYTYPSISSTLLQNCYLKSDQLAREASPFTQDVYIELHLIGYILRKCTKNKYAQINPLSIPFSPLALYRY